MRADAPELLMWDIISDEYRYTPARGDVVLDIGAHFGFFSLFCAMRGASVIAYEPAPYNFKELQKKVACAKELGGMTILAHNAAIWSETGERLLWLDAENSGANSMVLPCSEVAEMVRTVSLSEALHESERFGRLGFSCVKVDVEGAEAQIFLSAKSSDFQKIQYLTMELHNHVLTREQHDTLLLRLQKEFPKVEQKLEYRDGLPTGRTAAVFCGSV